MNSTVFFFCFFFHIEIIWQAKNITINFHSRIMCLTVWQHSGYNCVKFSSSPLPLYMLCYVSSSNAAHNTHNHDKSITRNERDYKWKKKKLLFWEWDDKGEQKTTTTTTLTWIQNEKGFVFSIDSIPRIFISFALISM